MWGSGKTQESSKMQEIGNRQEKSRKEAEHRGA